MSLLLLLLLLLLMHFLNNRSHFDLNRPWSFCLTWGELELNLTEARSLLEKRNEEFELKIKEVMKLREVIKTAEQEKFQELGKVLWSITTAWRKLNVWKRQNPPAKHQKRQVLLPVQFFCQV